MTSTQVVEALAEPLWIVAQKRHYVGFVASIQAGHALAEMLREPLLEMLRTHDVKITVQLSDREAPSDESYNFV